MATISMSVSEDLKVRPVKEKVPQGWVAGLDIGYGTTVYLTKAEAVDLFAALAAILKEDNR